MAIVRQLFIQNKEGERISCMLRSHMLNEMAGFGYAHENNFLRWRDGFYINTDIRTVQPTISGILSFVNIVQAYNDYRTLTEWLITNQNQLTLVYIPYGDEEYLIDIVVESLEKDEIKGVLNCPITFKAVTPYYSSRIIKIDFGETEVQNPKKYTYKYPYRYGLGSASGGVLFSVDGQYDAGIRFTATGSFSAPVLVLRNSETNERIGYLDLSNSAFNNETLLYEITNDRNGVWRIHNGVYEDITNEIVIHSGESSFFLIPANTPLRMYFQATSTVSPEAIVELFRYWKTR